MGFELIHEHTTVTLNQVLFLHENDFTD